MSKIHHLFGEGEPCPKPRTRGPYRKKVSAAEIERVVRTADKLRLTIYSLTIKGDEIHLQTKPSPEAKSASTSEVDAWFSRNE